MWNQYSGGTRRKPTIVVGGDAFSVFCFSLFGKRHWSKPLNQTEQGPGAGPAGGLVVPGFQGSFHDKQQLDPSSWIDCCTAVYLYCAYFETNHFQLACFYTILSVYCVMRVCVCARVNAWCVMPDILNERYGMVEFFNDGGCQGPLNS